MQRFQTAFHALPLGTHKGSFDGRVHVFSKSGFAHGKSWKPVAEEPGGTGYISLNLNDLASGPRLYPCEMPADKVVTFLCGLKRTGWFLVRIFGVNPA